MSDFCDDAKAAEETYLCAALGARRPYPVGSGPDWIDGVAHCWECGDVIPEARLAAVPGVGLCVACAD